MACPSFPNVASVAACNESDGARIGPGITLGEMESGQRSTLRGTPRMVDHKAAASTATVILPDDLAVSSIADRIWLPMSPDPLLLAKHCTNGAAANRVATTTTTTKLELSEQYILKGLRC